MLWLQICWWAVISPPAFLTVESFSRSGLWMTLTGQKCPMNISTVWAQDQMVTTQLQMEMVSVYTSPNLLIRLTYWPFELLSIDWKVTSICHTIIKKIELQVCLHLRPSYRCICLGCEERSLNTKLFPSCLKIIRRKKVMTIFIRSVISKGKEKTLFPTFLMETYLGQLPHKMF